MYYQSTFQLIENLARSVMQRCHRGWVDGDEVDIVRDQAGRVGHPVSGGEEPVKHYNCLLISLAYHRHPYCIGIP